MLWLYFHLSAATAWQWSKCGLTRLQAQQRVDQLGPYSQTITFEDTLTFVATDALTSDSNPGTVQRMPLLIHTPMHLALVMRKWRYPWKRSSENMIPFFGPLWNKSLILCQIQYFRYLIIWTFRQSLLSPHDWLATVNSLKAETCTVFLFDSIFTYVSPVLYIFFWQSRAKQVRGVLL